MPGIRFRNFAFAGGGGDATQFTQDLAANGVALFNPNLWLTLHGVPATATTDFFGADVVSTPPLQARFARTGGTGGSPNPTYFYPQLLVNGSVQGQPQFAEGTIVSKSGGASECGPAVMCSGDTAFDQNSPWPTSAGHNGYAALTQAGNNTTVRIRRASITQTVLSTIAGWALGDLIRIRVTPGTASHLVETFRNGVLVDSITDANAVRPGAGTGWPCFMVGNIAIPTASNSIWTGLNFGLF